MQHSSSAPLLAAGASTMNSYSHVPKKVTQNMCYVPLHEATPIQLKCGQADLRKRDLYVNESRPLASTYVDEDNQKGSVYARQMANLTNNDDFKNRDRPYKPQEPDGKTGHMGTAHWVSASHAQHSAEAVDNSRKHAQWGPAHRPVNPPSCVNRQEEPTSYWDDYGKPGTDPRSKWRSNSMGAMRTHLTVGTTKGTYHMPSYAGFIPTNTVNPRVAEIAEGRTLRTTYNKSNLTQEFHQNTLGYTGHVPMDARNDRGSRGPSSLTTYGRDFPTHPIGVFNAF